MIDFTKPLIITTDNWFLAPDGHQYKHVWGTARVVNAETVLGRKPERSADWFVVVGEGFGAVMIAGCQIHYVVQCDIAPPMVQKDGMTCYVPLSCRSGS